MSGLTPEEIALVSADGNLEYEFSAENQEMPAEPITPLHPDYVTDRILARLEAIEAQQKNLTTAVNQIGSMMQFIQDQVAMVGQTVAKGGIGGLMTMFKGGSNG